MKFVLIGVNLLLALWLLAAVGSRFASGSPKTEGFSVKKSDPGKKAAAPGVAAVKAPPPESVESQLATIVDNNIFNPDRCPNAVFGGRGRSARVELTLVGTFEIGVSKGAIILQKTSSENRNFPNMTGMMGGPGMGPGGGDQSGQQSGGSRNSAANRQGAGRNRFSGGGNRAGAAGGDSAAVGQATAVKQYVRVGETLSNGYTLTEITRTGAVLTRGGDKMELELQDPSKNQSTAAATNGNNRNNFLQQFQQMQQMQLMQNFQIMRMMRDSTRNNQNQGGGNRGGGSSGNRSGGFGGGGPGGPPPGM